MKLRSLKAHLIQVHIIIYVHIMNRISGPAARGEVPALLANVQRSATAAAALCNLCCEDAARNKALELAAIEKVRAEGGSQDVSAATLSEVLQFGSASDRSATPAVFSLAASMDALSQE